MLRCNFILVGFDRTKFCFSFSCVSILVLLTSIIHLYSDKQRISRWLRLISTAALGLMAIDIQLRNLCWVYCFLAQTTTYTRELTGSPLQSFAVQWTNLRKNTRHSACFSTSWSCLSEVSCIIRHNAHWNYLFAPSIIESIISPILCLFGQRSDG